MYLQFMTVLFKKPIMYCSGLRLEQLLPIELIKMNGRNLKDGSLLVQFPEEMRKKYRYKSVAHYYPPKAQNAIRYTFD